MENKPMEGTFNVKELRRDFTGKPQSVHYSKPIDKGMITELQPSCDKSCSPSDWQNKCVENGCNTEQPKETVFEKYLTESLDSSWQNGRIYGQGEIRLRILEAVNKNLDITVVEILKLLNEPI